MAGDHIHVVTDQNFDDEVLNSDEPVLVDFWASWCGPCMALGPTIDLVATENAGKVKVCKLNVDENPNMAAKFNVRSIPTLILFKDGKNIGQLVGGVPKGIIDELLKKA